MSNFSKSPNELYGWDVNKQLSQAKKINTDREQGLIKYKKKTQVYNDLKSELDKYEAEGTDVSSLRKKLDSKMELGLKDSLGVVGRNIGREYAKTAYKILGVDNPEALNTYRDRVDNAKFERESSVNPYSTLAKDIALDPANLVPINFASKGTKAIRMAKDFGKGAGIVGGLSFARDYGKDEYDPITTGVSAITGGTINSLLGRVINRKVSGNLSNADVTSAENIKAKAKEKGITLIDNGKSTLKDGKYENPKIDAEDIFSKINNEDGTPAPLQKRRVEPEFRKEKINLDKPKEPNFTFTTKDDVNPAYIPSTIESNNINNLIKRALQKRLDSASKHQNYEELLNNRKDVLAKEILYKKNLENPRLILHDNKGDGYETDVIPASYSKNYNSDFRLTKKDVRDIKNKKLTPKLLNKLEDDLGAYDEPSSPYYKGFDTNNNGEVIGSDGKPLFANGQATLAGGFAGGTDSSINERDYDGNGVHNERDVLIGSLIGAIGLKASQKLFPKMFKAEDGDVTGTFVGASKKKDNKLYATHRTNFDGLNRMLDNGVLPAPSYALAKNSKVTDNFGDIIIVPKEKHIDPKKGAHVFGGDAWTPRIKFNPNDKIEVTNLEAPILNYMPSSMKRFAKDAYDGEDFYNLILNDERLVYAMEKWGKNNDMDVYEVAKEAQKQIFKEVEQNIDNKIKDIKKNIRQNDGDMRGLEGGFVPEYIYNYEKYHNLDDISKRGKELKTFKDKDKFYEQAQKAMHNGTQPPADYMEAKRLDKVKLDDVSRVIVPSEDFEKVKNMFKEKGIEVPIIRQRKGETSNSAIKRSSDGKSDYIYSSPTVSGAIAGGFSGTQIDYNNDGVTDEKDILIGALGGAAGAKSIKHTDYLKRKAKTIKDFTNEKILDTKMADFIFGHKIYNKHHYMAFREKMISDKNHLNTDYELLHNKLLLVDEQTRKDMYRYMSGENVALTPNVKQFADKYIKTINETTQDLVNLGVLEQAQADKFKGKYLKRVYTSKLGDSGLGSKGKKIESVHGRGRQWIGTTKEFKEYEKQGLLGDFFDGKIEAYKQPNGKYKFTQDWSQEQRERWGEVEDIAYSLPETLRRINEMKQHSLFLKDVAKRSEYALDSEADGYVRVDGKKYGLLKGKYIPTDIKRDIDEFNNALFGMDEKYKEMWRTFSTYWKKSKTVYNPTAHVNNVMSNVVMQIMEGINPAKAFKNAKAGMEASQKVAQLNELMSKQLIGLLPEEEDSMNALLKDSDVSLYMEAEKLGLFGRSRLNDILGNYVKGTDKSQTLLGSKTLNKMDETSSKWYQAEDDIMRFSVLKAFVENGYSIKKAVKKTNTIIPDYTKPISGFANIGRNTLLAPFISWTYYATPILYRQAKEHPERLALIAGAMYGINRLAGVDPLSKEDIPQQNFSMKRIPIYVNGNEVTTIKVDRWIPHLDLLSPHDFAKNLTNLGFWGNVTGSIRNVHPFFGGKITYRDGIGGAYDMAKYNIQNTLPTPMLFNQAYNLAESQILSKKSRKKHPVIQPRSGVEEALKLLGVNIMTYDKEQQRKKAYRDRLK